MPPPDPPPGPPPGPPPPGSARRHLDLPGGEGEGGACGGGRATTGSAAETSSRAAVAWICPAEKGKEGLTADPASPTAPPPDPPPGPPPGPPSPGSAWWRGEGGARGRSGLPGRATAGPAAVHAWIHGRRPRSTPRSVSVHTGALAWIRDRDAAPPRASSHRPPPIEGGGEGGGGPPVEGGR
ncbi:uncharacterized protein [Miscanthus floridulus]|uniref:uncharacterized protein n=1 Tax=Miscanthus floridulus TaxID=154761 RepID=UPI00345B1529